MAATLWQRKLWIILGTVLGLFAAGLFLPFIAPVYQASLTLLVDSGRTDDQANRVTASQMQGELSVLRSEELLQAVATRLELERHPEFQAADDQLVSGFQISVWLERFGSKKEETPFQNDLLAELYQRISVSLIGEGPFVSVKVNAGDPVLVADVANAIGLEYLKRQKTTEAPVDPEPLPFAENDIKTLNQDARLAERAVDVFRSDPAFIAASENARQSRLQLTELVMLSNEMAGKQAEVRAKADQIRTSLASGGDLDGLSVVQESPVMQRLRRQQSALKTEISDLSISLLPNHPQLKTARQQLEDVERQINRQIRNILRALEGDAEIAKTQYEALQKEVTRLKADIAQFNGEESRLRALEAEARRRREVATSALEQQNQALSRQQLVLPPQRSGARIVSEARIPIEVHFPKVSAVLTIGGVIGFAISAFLVSVIPVAAHPVGIAAGKVKHGPIVEHNQTEVVPVKRQKDVVDLAEISEPEEPILEQTVDRNLSGDENLPDEPEVSGEETNEADIADEQNAFEQPSSVDEQVDETLPAPKVSVEGQEVSQETDIDAALPPIVASIEDEGGSEKEPAPTMSDLYRLTDAVDIINKHQLREIFVFGVEDNLQCADMALNLARNLARHHDGVLFVDLTPELSDAEPALIGFSDLLLGEADPTHAVLPDPLSDADLIMHGRAPIHALDWLEGDVDDLLDNISASYQVLVVNCEACNKRDCFDLIAERSDMLVFISDEFITRQEVSEYLAHSRIVVPRHSIFIGMNDDDEETSAA